MGIESFNVVIDSLDFFKPGQTVRGAVIVNNKKRVNFSEFYVEAKGGAFVSWSRDSKDGSDQYGARETYLDLKIPLLTGNHTRGEQLPGQHRFPFSFKLPMYIAPSFEGSKGYVRYSVKAVMKRMWCKSDYTSEVSFNVQVPVNLSTWVAPKKSRFVSRTITVEAWIDRSEYVAGETILFNAKIENSSGVSVRENVVQLIQYITFFDSKHHHRHVTKNVLQEYRRGKIRNQEVHLWDKFPIYIPRQVPPSGLPFCSIINVFYGIKLISAVELRLRILIGNVVPLRNHLSLNLERQLLPNLSDLSLATATSSSSLASFVGMLPEYGDALHRREQPESPPPTYEECLKNGF